MIRSAKPDDTEQIANIYNYYIENTCITFEENLVSNDEMSARLQENLSSGLPWLVAENDTGVIIGYAYASKWKGRCAYRFSAEVTVYLSHTATSKGWGTKLYEALFLKLKKLSIHTVIGGISLPNPTSIALHEKFAMQKVAHFKEVGFKFDQWIDVAYWQGKL